VDERIVAALTDDLRRAPWQGSPNPLAGHCYVASEVYWHLNGGPSSGLVPQVIRHEGATHWFLRATDGRVIDLTADQFSTPVPYHLARGCGFLTKRPSKRAAIVIERIQEG
jgi:hypothetical protein